MLLRDVGIGERVLDGEILQKDWEDLRRKDRSAEDHLQKLNRERER